jgi:hypothetical protein
MNRGFKITALLVVLCIVSLIFVACGKKSDGDTSGNASNGHVSRDGSGGGVVSEAVSMGGEVVSKVGDAISEFVSDILPDKTSEDASYNSSETPSVSETTSDIFNNSDENISFVSAGEAKGL